MPDETSGSLSGAAVSGVTVEAVAVSVVFPAFFRSFFFIGLTGDWCMTKIGPNYSTCGYGTMMVFRRAFNVTDLMFHVEQFPVP